MKYWWVNQSGSHEIEHPGSFLWSPKKEITGARSLAYENMNTVSPGDYVFSNVDAHIVAIGTIQSYSESFSRPNNYPDFQNAGNNDGWKVHCKFKTVAHPLRHSNYAEQIRPLLPAKYSPIDINGKAVMKLYLIELSNELAHKLMDLLKISNLDFPKLVNQDIPVSQNIAAQDETIIHSILTSTLDETEKETLVKARRGQGLFREKLLLLESNCRITKMTNPSFLVASHIKPWRECTNEERIDGNNGLLLTPNLDRLFDRNFISFSDNGELLISDLLNEFELTCFGIYRGLNIGQLRPEQLPYIRHHRSRLKTK